MEDKLFYFPETQNPNQALWKDLKTSVQTQTSEWSIKQDASGERFGTLSLNNIHKLYVTLVGGGGSGSIGEKRPRNSTLSYAIANNDYTAYTQMTPLPGCGGGGAATIFRIPIVLIQSQSTTIDYIVGRGGTGMVDTSDSPIKTAQQRMGKNGENTSMVIKQFNSQGTETKIFKLKAIGGGGGGVVGYLKSRENIWAMNSSQVEYIWDWSFGKEFSIDNTENTLENKATYLAEGNVTPDGAVAGSLIAATIFFGIISLGVLATVGGVASALLIVDLYDERPDGKNHQRFQWWNVRHDDDKNNSAYYQTTHLKRLAEDWTIIFRRPSYVHVAFHRELEFPIGSGTESETASNRNEYIPYNLLTHGEDGILKLEYFKPYDKIKLSYTNEEKYFGGTLDMKQGDAIVTRIQDLHQSGILPDSSYTPSDSGWYRTINSNGGVDDVRKFKNVSAPNSYNFLWHYAPEKHYVDDRSWVQIWLNNVDRLRNHPRYYLRVGDTYLYKDKSSVFPTDSYLPAMTPSRKKITIFGNGKEDIVLDRWSPEFESLMKDYGGPVRKIPQKKGQTGAFGGAGGGFLHYDDHVPLTIHGLYGGKEMYNPWKIPESGRGGNPYPRHIWNTIDIKLLDESGLEGAYNYWGGEGYADADSRGKSSYMTMYFIPGSGGGALDYHHQNKRISRRKYSEQEVDFQDILPGLSESPYTDIDDRIYKWYAEHHDELATGGRIQYRLRDASNNAPISRLYMNDLYGTHKINFTNKGETGPRSNEDLLIIFGAGGGGGKAFYYTPGNGQENPDMEPNIPGYGCGSGGSCSLNLDGAAAVIGLPTGSVDFYLRKMISFNEYELYIDFHDKAKTRIIGAFGGVLAAIIITNILITIVTNVLLPGVGATIMATGKAAMLAAKSGKQTIGFIKNICRIIYSVVKEVKKFIKQVKALLKSIFQKIRAFFKMIWNRSTKFSKYLTIVKEADNVASLIASQMAKVAKLKEGIKLAKIATGTATLKEKVIFQLKKIGKNFLSLLTGDVGDIFVSSFDKIAVKVNKQGILVGKIQNRIYQAIFGKLLKNMKNAIKATKGISKTGIAAAKITNAAEISTDIGRVVGGSLDNVDNVVKNADNIKVADQIKSATNTLENVDNVRVSKAHDDIMDGIKKAMDRKSVDNLDTNKLIDDILDGKTNVLYKMEGAERQATLKQLATSLQDQSKILGDSPTLSQHKAFQQLNDRVTALTKTGDEQASQAAKIADSKVVDPEIIMTPRADPETIESSLKTLEPLQRQTLFDNLNTNLTKLDPNSRMNLESLKKMLGDQNQVLKYRIVPETNTLELLRTGSLIKSTDATGMIQVNKEISKIFDDFPGLSNIAKNGQASSKTTVLRSTLGSGQDVVSQVNKNPQMVDELVGMMKNGELSSMSKNIPAENVAKYNPDDMGDLVNNLVKNDNFKNMIASNPAKLDELKSLTKMTPEQFAKVKLSAFDGILKQRPDYLPNLMRGLKADDVKAFKGLGATMENSDLFKQVDEFVKGKKLSSNLENGKAVFKLDGEDVTGVMDEFTEVKKADIQAKLDDPNKMITKELNPKSDVDPDIYYKEKSLSEVSQQKLKNSDFNLDNVDNATKNNLYDDITNEKLVSQIQAHKAQIQVNYNNAKANAMKIIDPNNPLAEGSLKAIDDVYQAKLKACDDVLGELDEIKKVDPKQKLFVENTKPLYDPKFADQSTFAKNGVERVKADDLSKIVDTKKGDVDMDALKKAQDDVAKELDETNEAIVKNQKEIDEANAFNKDIELKNREEVKRYNEDVLKQNQNISDYQIKKEKYDKEFREATELQKLKDEELLKVKRNNEARQFNIDQEAKLKAEISDDLEISWKKDPNTGEDLVGEPSMTVEKYKTGAGSNAREVELPEIKSRISNSKTKEVISFGDDVKVPMMEYNPRTKKYDTPMVRDGKVVMTNNPKNFTNLDINPTGSANNVKFEQVKGKQRAVDILAKLEFKKIEPVDPIILNTDIKFPDKIPDPTGSVKPPEVFTPRNVPDPSILKEKKKLIEDTAKKLSEIGKQNPMRKFKPTKTAPPVPVDPQNIIQKKIEIPIDPVRVSDVEVTIKPDPQNNHEFLFTLYSDADYRPPSRFGKNPIQKQPLDRPRPIRKPNPSPTIADKEDMFEWIKIHQTLPGLPPLRLVYHLIYGLNRLFNTNQFSKLKTMKYRDPSDNEQEINPEIMLKPTIEPTNFIQNCVNDLLDKKPEFDETRFLIYEDVFIELFDYPIKIDKSEIDNEMITLLMDQRRRGIAVDVEYMKRFVNYDRLNIQNKLNYQYLSNDFQKVQTLLFNQVNIIKKNHMVFV